MSTAVPASEVDPDAVTRPLPAVDQTRPRHQLRDDPGGPGTTRVVNAAVEKLAAYAAGEVEHVGGAANRILGVAVGADSADRSPKVTADVDGATASLSLRLSVNYPAPVRQVTDQVRAHLTDRLRELTGLTVHRVDITVAALHAPEAPTRRLQ